MFQSLSQHEANSLQAYIQDRTNQSDWPHQ
jgi:hypothetical protein